MTRHKQAAQLYGTLNDREGMAAGLSVAHIKQTTLDLQSPAAEVEKEQGNGSSPEASTVGGGQQSASEQMPRDSAAQTQPQRARGGAELEK